MKLPPLNPNDNGDAVVDLVNVKSHDFLALLKVLLPHGLYVRSLEIVRSPRSTFEPLGLVRDLEIA